MKRKFKRKIATYICFIEILLALIIIGSYLYFAISRRIDGAGVIAMLLVMSFFVINDIVDEIMPKDFEYNITLRDSVIIFEMSTEDHRVISREFTEVSKTKKEITLKDENSIITIPYNHEVLKFLKEIQE